MNTIGVMGLVSICITLLGLAGWLYSQKTQYQKENRKLILQNDSVMSVNIALKTAINSPRLASKSDREKKKKQ